MLTNPISHQHPNFTSTYHEFEALKHVSWAQCGPSRGILLGTVKLRESSLTPLLHTSTNTSDQDQSLLMHWCKQGIMATFSYIFSSVFGLLVLKNHFCSLKTKGVIFRCDKHLYSRLCNSRNITTLLSSREGLNQEGLNQDGLNNFFRYPVSGCIKMCQDVS